MSKWAKQRLSSSRNKANRRGIRWRLAELEARLMLAGDAAPAVAACVAAPQSQAVTVPSESCGSEQAVSTIAAEHLVILDAAVADQSAWAEAAPEGAVLVVLPPNGDPIAEISNLLGQHTN
jgi:hypothetical protein